MTLTHRLNQISQHLTNAHLKQRVDEKGHVKPLSGNEVNREIGLASQYFHEVLPLLLKETEEA